MGQVMTRAAGFLRRHSHTNWALADQTMVSGANFLTGIILARGLGVAEFGRFSLLWLVVLFVQSLQYNGIIVAMMSIGPKQEAHQRSTYYGGVFLQQAILASVSTILTWASLHFAGAIIGDSGMVPLAVSLAAAVLFSQTQEFLRRYFFAIQDPAAGFVGDFIRYGSQVAILFWLFIATWRVHGVSAALWTIAGTSGVGALIVLRSVGRLGWGVAGLRRTALPNWRFSRWLVGAALAYWMSGNLFIVAAGALLGVTAVGALKAAQGLIGVTQILFQGLENVVPVRASQRFHSGGPSDLVHYLTKVTTLGLMATAFIALFFALDPAFWFRHLLGDEFVQYGYLLRWYAALSTLMFLGLPLGVGLRAMEKTQSIFLGYVAGAVFSLVAAYPLIKGFGLEGVMVGLFSIQLLLLVIMAISLRRALVGRQT
jgi:O-antigen/teichoic acid export membrane protein